MMEHFDLIRSAASVEQILRICRRRGRILIVVQNNPDPDALASAAILRELLSSHLKKRAVIGYAGTCGRAENKAMNRVLRIGARRIELDDLEAFATICMVDTQPRFGNNSLGAVCHASVVIDHHITPHGATPEADFCDVRPTYGATSTILYEYSLVSKLKLTPPLATALFYGIQSDTQDLGRETSPADMDAYLALFAAADKMKLAQIHRAPVPVDYFRVLQDSLIGCVVAGTTVISAIREGFNPDMMAEVADRMLRLEGVRASVCYGVCGDTIHLSARTVDGRSNAARKMRRVVRRIGAGGGHNTVAGGQIPVNGDPEKRMAIVQARILKAFAANKPPKPLLTQKRTAK